MPSSSHRLLCEHGGHGDGTLSFPGTLSTTGREGVGHACDGGRHASVADGSVLGAGGQWIWVRPDGGTLGQLTDLVVRGDLVVPVARVFALADLAGAFALSRDGHTPGKIVVQVSQD